MLNKIKNSTFLRNFKNNTDGTMVVTYAVSLMATMASIGVAYDTAYYFTGKENAQHTADMIALSATTYLRDHGEPSLDEDFANGQVYYLDDYDLDITPYVSELLDEDGNKVHRTQFTIEYDTPEEGLLTTTVKATGQPKVMSIFNIDEFKFEATSVTSYLKEDLKDPASILFILDNSGSMRFDEDGNDPEDYGVTVDEEDRRIYALRETMNDFESKMSAMTATSPGVLRTGMYAFSAEDYSRTEEVDSTCPEEVVVGTVEVYMGVQEVGTGQYEISEENTWISKWDDRYVKKDHKAYKRANGNYSNSNQGYWEVVETSTEITKEQDVYETQNVYETQQVACTIEVETQITDDDAIVIATKTDLDWNMFDADIIEQLDHYVGTYPSGALALAATAMEAEEAIHIAVNPDAEPKRYVILMTDGNISGNSDESDSEDSCDDLKDDGVTVYTIGFAINSGSDADDFLDECASPGKYVLADDADALDEAFEQIGEDILEALIRIQS